MAVTPNTYFDYNATAPVRPSVIDAVSDVMAEVGNPSSIHTAGRLARHVVETSRDQVASLVGAQCGSVVFTSGGTEADNLAIKASPARRLIVSAVEHGAVLAPALLFRADTEVIPVDEQGVISLSDLETALRVSDEPALISVMLANNETGTIQPLKAIVGLAHDYGALVHTDAVQAAGKIPIGFDALGVDMLSISAHKIGGPQGIGALILKKDCNVDAQIHGGGQENGRRAGTENVAGCAGFGEAAEISLKSLDQYGEVSSLRNRMEEGIRQVAEHCRVFSDGVERLPNTSCLTMPGVKSETQLMLYDLAGFALSAGSACSSGKITPSHVLEAMRVPDDEAMNAVRVSLGWDSTMEDVERFIVLWADIWAKHGIRAHAA